MNKTDGEKNESPELKHEYDGIHECNYPAPQWWQILFYACIVWGVGYIFYYSLFEGETLKHRLDRQLVELERIRLNTVATGPSNEDLIALARNPEILKSGKGTFLGKCSSCHGEHGQGIIGPNLTDHFWLHGKGKPSDIFHTVDKGVADKGMPPWGPILSSTDLKAVVAYVTTLQDTHPENPKTPQGTEVKP